MFKFLNKTQPVSFFVFAAVLFGIWYTCVRPPMQSPDEFNHFCRAYQISEGHFIPEKIDKRLGGQTPVSFEQFNLLYVPCTYLPDYRLGLHEIMEGFEIELSRDDVKFIDFPNTSYYSPIAYLPQAFALVILKQFNPSVGLLYYGSRIFSYLIWIFSMMLIIRLLPFYKWLFVLLILIPEDIYINNSISADLTTNILSLLLIAFILRSAFNDKPFTSKDFGWVLLLGILLALTKIIYISLLLLLFIIPAEKFITRPKKIIYCGIIFIVSVIVAQIWSNHIMNYYIPYGKYHEVMRDFTTLHNKADYHLQKEHLKQNPFQFFKVIYNSFFNDSFYVKTYIGGFGAFMDTVLPWWFVIPYFVIIIFVAITEFTTRILSRFQKLFLFLAALGTYILLIVTQHLTWNTIGNDIIEDFQGRYLVPVFPLMFMLLNQSWRKIKFNSSVLVMLCVLISNIYCCELLYKKYIKNSSTTMIKTFYNVDEVKDQKTANEGAKIFNVKGRSSSHYRSANYSVALAPDSSKKFVYKFDKAKSKDLIEIFFWRKGGDARIEASGFKNCFPFKFINNNVELKNDSGWVRSRSFFSFSNDCTGSGEFYVFNPGKDTVYLDDFRFELIRNK